MRNSKRNNIGKIGNDIIKKEINNDSSTAAIGSATIKINLENDLTSEVKGNELIKVNVTKATRTSKRHEMRKKKLNSDNNKSIDNKSNEHQQQGKKQKVTENRTSLLSNDKIMSSGNNVNILSISSTSSSLTPTDNLNGNQLPSSSLLSLLTSTSTSTSTSLSSSSSSSSSPAKNNNLTTTTTTSINNSGKISSDGGSIGVIGSIVNTKRISGGVNNTQQNSVQHVQQSSKNLQQTIIQQQQEQHQQLTMNTTNSNNLNSEPCLGGPGPGGGGGLGGSIGGGGVVSNSIGNSSNNNININNNSGGGYNSNVNNSNNNSPSSASSSASSQLRCNSYNYNNNHQPLHTQTTFSLNKNEEFQFTKPPECPVFKPNEEEFKNPLSYISKIRPVAEKYGICKIQPPKTWTPPFTVDVDEFRFTPRVQRLNELEAKTRVKLNFLDQIAKFWELQGSSLKIPMVERKALDLYTLHRFVQEEGGMETITKERKWSRVAQRMRYPAGKSVGAILKGHYERILHPFDIFTSGKVVDLKLETEVDDQDYKPHGIVSRQQITPPNPTTAKRSKRFAALAAGKDTACGLSTHSCNSSTTQPGIKIEKTDEDDLKTCDPKEYRRLQINGFCKMTGCGPKGSRSRMAYFNNKKKAKETDPLAKYICHICNRGDIEEAMLLCDGCDDSYHTFCLIPPLNDIPKGDWRCPKCVVEEVSKPQEAFGFEQAQREYTLQQFGEMADQFKADYFNMSVHLVPTDLVEREFWRIVSSIDEDVTVEYGADLHTMDHGSGFPTRSSLYLQPRDQEYAESSWNLNNLPLLEESILGHINADISGMKIPWMYVGMCFATFCWHNEDHWSYSINYLHWGEAKTWYGVPGSKAELFEDTMKSAAPELFQSQPDLLHQLVTIMNPNILTNSGVPVYRTDQRAGEFVITFPRAYHAGFNQGYNFAEAVNFAPADWLKMGRECINHYSALRRFCVFSHDELVCKMALNPDKLNLGIATACYLDMAEMVDSEKKLRKCLLDWGVTKAEREAFELIPDDERQCESCKTTCFLSAVTCTCTRAIVCLRHYAELCECPAEKHTLRYRYTLDELPLMLKKLKVKAESFENWLSKVRDVLDPNTPTTITLEELQELAKEAEIKKFPSSVLLERLNSAVLEAEKCVTVIQQLDINKMRTRTRNSCESAKYKLTLDELEMFVQEIDNLCCVIQEGHSVRELQQFGKEFVEAANKLLAQPINKVKDNQIERLMEDGSYLCIELPEMKALKYRQVQVNWYNKFREFREANEKPQLAELQKLLKDGCSVTPDSVIEKELIKLQDIVMAIEDWEAIAQKCFESGTQHQLPEIEMLLERAEEIEGELPSKAALKDAVKKAKEWLQTVEILQANENYPYFHTLESVVNRGKNIPFQLKELKRMEDHLKCAEVWKERTSRTFLKKQTSFTLMDVLSPRAEAVMVGSKLKKKPLEEQFTEDMGPIQMVNAFKNAEEKEVRDMRELRKINMEKNPLEDKYCICKRKFFGIMYHCQLCKDWFHESCVPAPKSTVRPRSSSSSSPGSPTNQAAPSGTTSSTFVPQLNVREKDREMKYLCLSCMRSRRPKLDTILSLLVLLQRLPIRLPEGEALQCLTERAMNWQDRARRAFAMKEVISALAALSMISQKLNGNNQGRNEGTAPSSTVPGRKRANKRKLQQQQRQKSEESEGILISSSEDEGYGKTCEEIVNEPRDNSPSSPTKIEHAYSVPSPNISSSMTNVVGGGGSAFNKVGTNLGGNSNSGNSVNLPKSDLPLIQLSKQTREILEDLMMEGDLLEVSIDETLHLWRILNAAKPSMSDLAYIQNRYKLMTNSSDILVNNNKKRKSDELGGNVNKRINKIKLSPSTITSGGTLLHNAPNKVKRGRKMKLVNRNMENNAIISLEGTETTISSGTGVTNNIVGGISPSVSGENKKIVMNEGKKRRRTGGGRKNQQDLSTSANLTSDDEEECSAPNCARPSGREVDWVQCDGGCNNWFHMFCVGLNKYQIKPDVDYICKSCKKTTQNKNTSSSPTGVTTTAVTTTVSSNTVVAATANINENASGEGDGGGDGEGEGEGEDGDVATVEVPSSPSISSISLLSLPKTPKKEKDDNVIDLTKSPKSSRTETTLSADSPNSSTIIFNPDSPQSVDSSPPLSPIPPPASIETTLNLLEF